MYQEDSKTQLIKALVEKEGIEIVDLSEIGAIDPEVINIIPEDIAVKYRTIPFARKDDVIHISLANPFDLDAQEALKAQTPHQTRFCYSPRGQIDEWLDKLYLHTDMTEEMDGSDGELVEDGGAMGFSIDVNDRGGADGSAIRFVNNILLHAIQERASDIHIEPHEKRVHVRFRIDGTLREVLTAPKQEHPGIVSRIKILSQLDIAERRVPQDGRSKLRIFGRNIDIRISTLPTINGEKVVMRILDKDMHSLNVADLGLEPELQRDFKTSLNEPYGMILVTGPTGSGKTTTLYSALNYVNLRDRNIITLEDPVEYQLRGVNQVPARPEIGLSFSAGLRAILRQDPDIIMVGEIRDLETAEIAMRASLTGHLVFSTLHTNNSLATIMRLIDMGIDRYLICASIHLVIAQRLVRRSCFHCSEIVEIADTLLEKFHAGGYDIATKTYRKGRGCMHCSGTGYWGRVAIFEFLHLNTELRELILNNASADEIRQRAKALHMEPLLANGLKKVQSGVTTVEEILRVTTDMF